MNRGKFLSVYTLADEIFVLINRIIRSTVVEVWWSTILIHGTELLAHLAVCSHGPGGIGSGEEAVSRYPVVVWCWLEVPEMLEVAHL